MKINILIGMPAYGGWIQIDTVNSILSYHAEKIPFSLMCIGNESLICRGRNTIISYFKFMIQFSHLLFLDADIGFKGVDLLKLISRNKDVIGVPVALKGFTAEGKPVYNVGEFIKQEGELFTTNRIGTAVFMLSRKAVDGLCVGADVYQSNPHTRGDAKPLPMYDVFKTGVTNGQYESEDFYCCKKLIELGYEIWVDPTLRTRHNGMWVFEG
jgi:hypothetical protein